MPINFKNIPLGKPFKKKWLDIIKRTNAFVNIITCSAYVSDEDGSDVILPLNAFKRVNKYLSIVDFPETEDEE